nr:hypothetical protein [Nanoarchaeum sp.]
MTKKVIEFVCSANKSRSPTAELIANNYISDNNIEGYIATSSGIYVRDIQESYSQAEQIPLKFCKQIISIALERNRTKNDLFSEVESKELERIITDLSKFDIEGHDLRIFQEQAYRAMIIFNEEERIYRAKVIKRLGIRGGSKSTPEQTKFREDTVLILGMGSHHVEFVKSIYSNRHPIIDTIKNYAYGTPNEPVEDGYGKGLEKYLETISVLKQGVHDALNKYFSIQPSHF